MKSIWIIHFLLICSIISTVKPEKNEYSKLTDSVHEKSVALYIAPNRTQNLKQALELQIFPTGITGHVYNNLSILAFVTIGYTIGGKKNLISKKEIMMKIAITIMSNSIC